MAETTTIAVSPINPKFRSQSVADEATTPEKKARPRKAPQRRSYMTDLAELQKEHADLESKVNMAVRLLKKTAESETNSPAARDLIAVAIETLEFD